jgi:hypothetical protein
MRAGYGPGYGAGPSPYNYPRPQQGSGLGGMGSLGGAALGALGGAAVGHMMGSHHHGVSVPRCPASLHAGPPGLSALEPSCCTLLHGIAHILATSCRKLC